MWNWRNCIGTVSWKKNIVLVCIVKASLHRLYHKSLLSPCPIYTRQILLPGRFFLLKPDRLERVGPCWLLKLRWMGTQRGQMKGILSRLVHWPCCAGTRYFCSALAALVGPVQNNFLHCTLFQFLCPHPPASWAGSRAWSPASKFVSLIKTDLV
jgi:hypothetical protein